MPQEILTFGNIEIEKKKFYRQFFLEDVDIEKVLVSKKIPFGEKSYKYFIGYLNDNHKFKPLHIMLPKAITYVKSYGGQTKWMYFLIEDDDLLKKYNTIPDDVRLISKRNLTASLCIIKNYLKTKIKSHGHEVTEFYDKKIPKVRP